MKRLPKELHKAINQAAHKRALGAYEAIRAELQADALRKVRERIPMAEILAELHTLVKP